MKEYTRSIQVNLEWNNRNHLKTPPPRPFKNITGNIFNDTVTMLEIPFELLKHREINKIQIDFIEYDCTFKPRVNKLCVNKQITSISI